MSRNELNEPSWLAWVRVQRKIAAALTERNFSGALSIIDTVLSEENHPEVVSGALAYRADIRRSLGEPLNAREDFLKAHSLSSAGSYSRYTLELCLGDVCCELGSPNEAEEWYRRALETCAAGKDFSGGSALRSLLTLRGESNLSQAERTLCGQVIQKSWTILKLPGEPNLKDILESTSTIEKAERSPRKRA